MASADEAGRTRERLARGGIVPSRALGQNFVADPNTVRRIAGLARVGPDDAVVEIGAGLGSLTLALVETGASVTAVEVDARLVEVLGEVLAGSGVRIVEADATQLDWHELLRDSHSWVLVANLPYNIATPLLLDLLDEVQEVSRMLVMVQHEVGRRLVARPGSKDYGIPSVKVAYWAEASIVGEVPPTVFLPQPRVSSCLVELVRHELPAAEADPAVLFGLVRKAFGQRRKMLRRSLAGEVTAAEFATAGVRPTDRPEQLGLDDWDRLAAAVA